MGARCPTHAFRKIEFTLFDIDSNDCCATRCAGQGTCQQTHGAGTQDEDFGAGLNVRALECLQDDREGFGKGGSVEVEGGGDSA